jgi:hypothetical protein
MYRMQASQVCLRELLGGNIKASVTSFRKYGL